MIPSVSAQPKHWTEAFLDVGYERGGQGPKAYDCWAFFRWVQRERFGRDLPAHATPPSLGGIARAMPVWAGEFGWQQVEKPKEGDAVFLSALKMSTHIGIWVADARAVLHCPEGGAVLHGARHLAATGWRLRGYYAPVT